MNKVLVPFAVAAIPKDAKIPLNIVRMTYVTKLAKYNLLPLFVSPAMSQEMVDELYAMSQGVLLLGGLDMNAKHYGQQLHPKNDCYDGGQDELEIGIVRRAIKDRKPLLGICRGCQVLAVSNGGTLFQYLKDSYPSEEHGIGEGNTYDHLLTQEKHEVLIDPESHCYRIVQEKRVFVNTGHHQSVDSPGEHLRIVGRSPEGVAEIIEHVDPDYFCFGVQSHPEAEDPSFFESIFAEFKKAVAGNTSTAGKS